MIPDLVTVLHKRLQRRAMLRDSGVGTHDEERDLHAGRSSTSSTYGDERREIRRPTLPPVVTVGLQV